MLERYLCGCAVAPDGGPVPKSPEPGVINGDEPVVPNPPTIGK